MPRFDLPLEQLREFRTETAEPPDLDPWWRRRLDQARAAAREPVLTRYEAGRCAPAAVAGAGPGGPPGIDATGDHRPGEAGRGNTRSFG